MRRLEQAQPAERAEPGGGGEGCPWRGPAAAAVGPGGELGDAERREEPGGAAAGAGESSAPPASANTRNSAASAGECQRGTQRSWA